jgi:alkylation response protein AidB-like acyl-CoA dehydrogenase
VDLRLSDDDLRFRDEARAWLAAHAPNPRLASHNTRDGFAAHVRWEQELFEAGWAIVSWPEAYGGRGASLVQWCLFEEEYYAAGCPARVTQNGVFLLAPTLFELGTDEQKARILRPMASAEYLWAQAWSEPNAGSDLANVASRARQVQGGWRVTGQKTWCSRGAFCDGIYGLFRTDPDSTRHRGLTYMMVDLDQDGVTLRPVEDLAAEEAFAEVFLEDAFVADRDVIGDVGAGWKVAMSTTSSERGLSLRSPGRFLAGARRLVDLWHQEGRDPSLRDRVLDACIDADVYRLHTFQTVARMMDGGSIGADSSLNKIFWSEMDIAMHDAALEMLGARAELTAGAGAACDDGRWLHDHLFSLAGPIYAGTNEVQRNIVARRVLDLPRG